MKVYRFGLIKNSNAIRNFEGKCMAPEMASIIAQVSESIRH